LQGNFFENDYDVDYESAKDGFEGECFERCIEIIEEVLDLAVEKAVEGIAGISLS